MQDFNLAPDENFREPVISRDDEFLHQQIDILFETTPGDLQGDSDFGTTYDELLYEQHLSTSQLERTMKSDLGLLDLRIQRRCDGYDSSRYSSRHSLNRGGLK